MVKMVNYRHYVYFILVKTIYEVNYSNGITALLRKARHQTISFRCCTNHNKMFLLFGLINKDFGHGWAIMMSKIHQRD